ncbi:MAG: hypothetical protein WBG02_12480 [Candidatus Acidiferrum sp.]
MVKVSHVLPYMIASQPHILVAAWIPKRDLFTGCIDYNPLIVNRLKFNTFNLIDAPCHGTQPDPHKSHL